MKDQQTINAPKVGKAGRPLDQWVRMFEETEEADKKIRKFAESIGVMVNSEGGGIWLLDAVMMLCENFAEIGDMERGSEDWVAARDFANRIQTALFNWTFESDACVSGYVARLSSGVRDYHYTLEGEEGDKCLADLGRYLQNEQKRRTESRKERLQEKEVSA